MKLGILKNINKRSHIDNSEKPNEGLLKKYGSVAYSTFDTILNTYNTTKNIIDNKVPGVIVECGVAAGAQIAVMHQCCLDNNVSIPIYAFDSFEGIPIASKDDDDQPGIGPITEHVEYNDPRELLKTSGITVHSLENTSWTIKQWFPTSYNNFIYVKGWFQDTVGDFKTPISLLRLDGDLYESTKVCLESLFPLLQPNGILIIDDWGLGGCQKACLEYFKTRTDIVELDIKRDFNDPKYFKKV